MILSFAGESFTTARGPAFATPCPSSIAMTGSSVGANLRISFRQFPQTDAGGTTSEGPSFARSSSSVMI